MCGEVIRSLREINVVIVRGLVHNLHWINSKGRPATLEDEHVFLAIENGVILVENQPSLQGDLNCEIFLCITI